MLWKKLVEEERWGRLYLFQTRANQTHNSKIAKSLVNTKRNTMKIVHIQRIQYNMILTLAHTFFTIIHSQLKERYYNPYYFLFFLFLSLSLSLSLFLSISLFYKDHMVKNKIIAFPLNHIGPETDNVNNISKLCIFHLMLAGKDCKFKD